MVELRRTAFSKGFRKVGNSPRPFKRNWESLLQKWIPKKSCSLSIRGSGMGSSENSVSNSYEIEICQISTTVTNIFRHATFEFIVIGFSIFPFENFSLKLTSLLLRKGSLYHIPPRHHLKIVAWNYRTTTKPTTIF